ncbi:hypothetical protein ACVDFE_35905 [Lentzea chajnantorensis]
MAPKLVRIVVRVQGKCPKGHPGWFDKTVDVPRGGRGSIETWGDCPQGCGPARMTGTYTA